MDEKLGFLAFFTVRPFVIFSQIGPVSVGRETNFPTTDGECGQNTHSHNTFVHVELITACTAQIFHSRNTRDDEHAPATGRPAPLMEVRPQLGYERHCGSGFELVFHVTVPQLGRRWWKCRRSNLTHFSAAFLEWCRGADLQSSLPGQGSSAFRGAEHQDLQDLRPGQGSAANIKVFKVYAQDRVQQRFVEQNIKIFKVFEVFSRDRVQQRFVEQNMKLRTVFSQDRDPQRFVGQNIMVTKALSPDRVQQQLVVELIFMVFCSSFRSGTVDAGCWSRLRRRRWWTTSRRTSGRWRISTSRRTVEHSGWRPVRLSAAFYSGGCARSGSARSLTANRNSTPERWRPDRVDCPGVVRQWIQFIRRPFVVFWV